MKTLITSALVFLFATNCFGQLQIIYGEPFDSLHKLAEKNLTTENFQVSVEYYNQAFSVYNNSFPCVLFYLDAFKACYSAEQVDQAVTYLDIYADLGMIRDQHYIKLTQSDTFALLRKQQEWPNILAKIDAKRTAYGEIFRQLQKINTADQTLRLLRACAAESLQDEDQHAYLTNLIGETDRTNLAYLDSIVTVHGWLGTYKVGQKGSTAMWLVVQHAELDVQERYLPMIRESVARGETSSASLAFLEDRIRLYRGQYQIYGTQVVKGDDGNYQVFPIENPAEVDVRRAALGFEPLAEYLDFFDIEITSPADLQIDRLLEKWKR